MHARRRGVTFIDLVIALVMALLLLGALAPVVRRTTADAQMVYCAANLRWIGQAMSSYASGNAGAYPRTRWDAKNPMPTQYTRWQAKDPFAADGPGSNDVTAALFLLMRAQNLSPAFFICPSGAATPWDGAGAAVSARSNFPGESTLGYSLQNPYPSDAAVKLGFRWKSVFPTAFALAADINPGTPEVLTVTPWTNFQGGSPANSPNHEGRGQNVLYGDLHCDFCQTPFSGVSLDNIYGVGQLKSDGKIDPMAYSLAGSPAHANDSVLLPLATGRPMRPRPWLDWGLHGYTYFSLLILVAITAAWVWALRAPWRGPGSL
jgi:hypothetical protein